MYPVFEYTLNMASHLGEATQDFGTRTNAHKKTPRLKTHHNKHQFIIRIIKRPLKIKTRNAKKMIEILQRDF